MGPCLTFWAQGLLLGAQIPPPAAWAPSHGLLAPSSGRSFLAICIPCTSPDDPSRPQMEFSVATWPLQSHGNVPGAPSCWVGCGGSLRPSSLQTYPVTSSSCILFSSHLPSTCSQAASCPGSRSDVCRAQPPCRASVLQFGRKMEMQLFLYLSCIMLT